MRMRAAESGWSDDAPLVRRALKGDAKAWADLVDRYSPYVYSLLRSAGVAEADQSDAFQYVFVELFRFLPSLKSSDRLAPWIRKTALRRAIRLREKTRRTEQLTEDHETIHSSEDPVERLVNADRRVRIHEALLDLSDRCRTLIQRLFLDEPPRSYAEVAIELGIKEVSLPMTRHRCLEHMERALQERGIE